MTDVEIGNISSFRSGNSYDSSYLDLAMRKGLPIATLDKKLIAAAKRSKVPILSGK